VMKAVALTESAVLIDSNGAKHHLGGRMRSLLLGDCPRR